MKIIIFVLKKKIVIEKTKYAKNSDPTAHDGPLNDSGFPKILCTKKIL
jgi:hypothetical protein